MRRTVILLAALLAAAVIPSFASPVGGTVTLTFSPNIGYAFPGTSLVFGGTIAGDPDILLNDLTVDFGPAGGFFTLDPNFFFDNTPGFAPYSGPILLISIAPSTPYGFYNATASLIGGADEFATGTVATAPFTVDVVPEPGSVFLLLGGVAACAAWRRRARSMEQL
jgi:hypothetical protein